MVEALMNWIRQNAYGQFAHRVFLALVSAAVTIALSYLPHDTILQAIWVVLSSLFIGYVALHQRLNETDESRYRRLFRSRFSYLEKADPEALTTIFAENIRLPVLRWFEEEQGVPLQQVQKIDALDSLARSGDQPGQLIFRTGVRLGQWLEQAKQAEVPALEHFSAAVDEFIGERTDLLGDEIAPGVYLRHVKPGEHRPVGVHMFHPQSRCLFTIETYDSERPRIAVALSLKSSLFDQATDEQWESFKQEVHRLFPCFQPVQGGSGPQRRPIPFFVSAAMPEWDTEREQVPAKLKELMERLPRGPSEDPSASQETAE